MKKRTGAIVFFSISLLFFLFLLVSDLIKGGRALSIVLIAVMVIISAVQLYLVCKGNQEKN